MKFQVLFDLRFEGSLLIPQIFIKDNNRTINKTVEERDSISAHMFPLSNSFYCMILPIHRETNI